MKAKTLSWSGAQKRESLTKSMATCFIAGLLGPKHEPSIQDHSTILVLHSQKVYVPMPLRLPQETMDVALQAPDKNSVNIDTGLLYTIILPVQHM